MCDHKSESVELFRVHAMLLNSERATIWQRYSAFLVANAIILNFLKDEPVLVPIAGLVVSGCWLTIHCTGYKLFRGQLNTLASRFRFDPMPGAPWYAQDVQKPKLDWIFWCSAGMIVAFSLLYIVIVVRPFI
jgi:hypothetical protein